MQQLAHRDVHGVFNRAGRRWSGRAAGRPRRARAPGRRARSAWTACCSTRPPPTRSAEPRRARLDGRAAAPALGRLAPWPDAVTTLVDDGWRVLALTPAADALDIRAVHRSTGDRVALLLGAEGPGLTAAAMARAERVRIPIADGVDSLNVGHAAAVAAWQLLA